MTFVLTDDHLAQIRALYVWTWTSFHDDEARLAAKAEEGGVLPEPEALQIVLQHAGDFAGTGEYENRDGLWVKT